MFSYDINKSSLSFSLRNVLELEYLENAPILTTLVSQSLLEYPTISDDLLPYFIIRLLLGIQW